MLKRTITYEDYNGVERKEDFYFNLNKAECFEMEMGYTGGLTNMIRKIIEAKDQVQIVKLFKEIILKAYGEKSEDGKLFLKKDKEGRPLSYKFEQSKAFSILYMDLALDAKAAADFVNGIMPKESEPSKDN